MLCSRIFALWGTLRRNYAEMHMVHVPIMSYSLNQEKCNANFPQNQPQCVLNYLRSIQIIKEQLPGNQGFLGLGGFKGCRTHKIAISVPLSLKPQPEFSFYGPERG